VGGGAAGLSSALHLAPLVEMGMIASPIDVYSIPPSLREIGVGVWSTALDPFRASGRLSHQQLYRELTSHGSWLSDVGYRTPSGRWLMTSHLPSSDAERTQLRNSLPALLFLREKDLLTALLKAAHWEQHQGTVHIHQDAGKMRVVGLQEDSSLPWSSKLVLEDDVLTERDYHLVVAADGTHSLLRQRYGGHQDSANARILTGTAKMMGPILNVGGMDNPSGGGMTASLSSPNELPLVSSSWNQMQQQEAVGLQDRNYTVFRGNSTLSTAEMRVVTPNAPNTAGANENGVSFQTWGEGKNMRFATVPLRYPVGIGHQREERQVWFITIDDDRIAEERDPERRRSLLLEAFQSWHDPIGRVVEATPPESILVERAVAHRHSMAPVLSLNRLLEKANGVRPPSSGEGPCLTFVGDANMTVDPILAQGFTVAMEGAFGLAEAVKGSCAPHPHDPSVAFHPYGLRQELQSRYEMSVDRILCLLRATELVQALGQPTGGTLSGFGNIHVLRPIVGLLPNVVKAPIFDAVLKYSLGVLGKGKEP
jgi:2-polyprenyl-6-methoxyphenol hydroxylase-like FAD-dependent oxidoreductase